MEILRDEALLRRYLASFDGEYPWLSRYSWQLLRYQKGEYLCRYREPVPQLLFLLEGRVTVSLTPPHGRTHIITYCQSGSLICGDVEVALGNTHATADLRADGGDVLCAGGSIPRQREALLSDLDFLRCCVRRLSREMLKDSIYSANNLLFPLDQRLAAYIMGAAREGVFQANLTRTAELLGVSYRQLSRIMGRFAEQGLLEKTPAGWRLLDRKRLAALGADIEPLEL